MKQYTPIGEIISNKLEEEGRSKRWLAEQIHCDPSCLCKTLKKPRMDDKTIMNISFVLKHNFFQYPSLYYEENKKEDGN